MVVVSFLACAVSMGIWSLGLGLVGTFVHDAENQLGARPSSKCSLLDHYFSSQVSDRPQDQSVSPLQSGLP